MAVIESRLRERPISYRGDMVRANLAGIKSQTRRVVAPHPGDNFHSFGELPTCECHPYGFHDGQRHWASPYGKPGDRLWVREEYQFAGRPDFRGWVGCRYAADGRWRDVCLGPDDLRKLDGRKTPPDRKQPGRFMYRSCSRINLEIVEVRVQRIQAITDADILAEGIGEYVRSKGLDLERTNIRAAWIDLWDNINAAREGGIYAWARNPWCWAITYRRIETGVAG